MSKRIIAALCCLTLILSLIPHKAFAASLDPVAFSFSDNHMKKLAESGSIFTPGANIKGEIVKGEPSQDGDGASYKAVHIPGTDYSSIPNGLKLEFGTPLSGEVEWTVSAWVYVPTDGNKQIADKQDLIGGGILINGNPGSNTHKYPTNAEEAGKIVYDTWMNVVMKVPVLNENISYIHFRFYTNDQATHPEVWYWDNIEVKMTADEPEIKTTEVADGFLTVPYEMEFVAAGNLPITWTLKGGNLPKGLSLSEDGLLSGIPQELADTTITIEAKNEFGEDTMDYKFLIHETDSAFNLSKTLGKPLGNSNPIITHKYGADPWAIEYKDRLYVYMTADTYNYDADGNITTASYGIIKHINVVSTADMVNWTDHGSIPVAGANGIAKWASNSWAPCVVQKNIDGEDKFFLYFANNGSGVGVIVGDSPVGPWTDPIGKALVNHSTPNSNSKLVPWCFDPAVFIDDYGIGYLYYGGGIDGLSNANPKSARVVRLKDNLTEIDGTPQELDPPYFFEALAMHKYKDKYYLSYSSNFNSPGALDGVRPGSGDIGYMIGDSPMGPFTYGGVAFPNTAAFGFGGGNNHHCLFTFRDQWYIAYHTLLVWKGVQDKNGQYYRSTSIDKLEYNPDGSIITITGTREGIAQLKTLDPYSKVEAETIAWNGGIETIMQDPSMADSDNLYVTSIENGDWISVSQADLGSTAPTSFTVSVAGKRGGIIELRSGSPDPFASESKLLASLTIDAGDGSTWMIEVVHISSDITGIQDLFLVFLGDANHTELFDLDWWQLGREEVDSNIKDDIESDEERLDEKDISADVTPDASDDTDDSNNLEVKNADIKDESKISTGLLVGVIVAIVLIVVGLMYLLRRRKLR